MSPTTLEICPFMRHNTALEDVELLVLLCKSMNDKPRIERLKGRLYRREVGAYMVEIFGLDKESISGINNWEKWKAKTSNMSISCLFR